jgi:hypothetical protein
MSARKPTGIYRYRVATGLHRVHKQSRSFLRWLHRRAK